MSGIVFGACTAAGLVGANDPYALTALAAGERVTMCGRCCVGYHAETADFLRQANEGKCVSCQRSDRMSVVVLPGTAAAVVPAETAAVAPAAGDRVVRLDKIWEHAGQIVTFEGYVHRVYQSRGTGTWFVKFERTPRPAEGFRLVIFNGFTKRWTAQGLDIRDYEGQTIRVRGLIRVDPVWGIQMLIDRPDVIGVVGEEKPAAPEPAAPAAEPEPEPPPAGRRILWKTEG